MSRKRKCQDIWPFFPPLLSRWYFGIAANSSVITAGNCNISPYFVASLIASLSSSLALASQADYWDSQAAIKIFTQILVLSLPCQLMGPGQV